MWGGRNINSPLHQISQIDISHQFKFVKTWFLIVTSQMQWILVSWYWMLWSHCSYFSALINQFLLDQVLEHFPLQYLCCWMNNQLSELGEKCISATAATVPQCIIVSLNGPRTEAHSPSRQFSLIFIFWENSCLNSGERKGDSKSLSTDQLGWVLIESLLRCSLDSLPSASFHLYRDLQYTALMHSILSTVCLMVQAGQTFPLLAWPTQSPTLYLWECLNVQSMQHIIFCIPSLNLFLYSKLVKDEPDKIDSKLSLYVCTLMSEEFYPPSSHVRLYPKLMSQHPWSIKIYLASTK